MPSGDASDAAFAVRGGAGCRRLSASYCASLDPAPLFCDDFDEDVLDAAALAAPWTQLTQTGRDRGAERWTLHTSPPFAMLVTSNAGGSSDRSLRVSGLQERAYARAYALSFDLYIAQADTSDARTSDAILGAIQLFDPVHSATWDLQLEVNYDAAANGLSVNLSENEKPGGYTPHPISGGTLPIGVWTRVGMVATIGGTNTGSIRFGTTSATVPVTPAPVGGYPEILVGGTFAEQSSQGWTVRYDNVTFDVQ